MLSAGQLFLKPAVLDVKQQESQATGVLDKTAAVNKIESKSAEKNIHLIWLGSQVRAPHVKKILQWKMINKDYEITVWVDEKYESAVKQQFANQQITVKSIASIDLSQDQKNLITKVTAPRDDKLLPNYAAASDILRFKILDMFGGWYVDTDIVPIDISKIKINSDFNFRINATRKKLYVNCLAPHVIYAGLDNLLTKIALKTFEKLDSCLTEEHIKLIRSSRASIRYIATENSTGFVLRAALGILNYNDKPIIRVAYDQTHSTTPDERIFDTLASDFKNDFEQSWLLDRVVWNPDDTVKVVELPGLIIDDSYYKAVASQDTSKIDSILKPIYILKAELFDSLIPVYKYNVSLQHGFIASAGVGVNKAQNSSQVADNVVASSLKLAS